MFISLHVSFRTSLFPSTFLSLHIYFPTRCFPNTFLSFGRFTHCSRLSATYIRFLLTYLLLRVTCELLILISIRVYSLCTLPLLSFSLLFLILLLSLSPGRLFNSFRPLTLSCVVSSFFLLISLTSFLFFSFVFHPFLLSPQPVHFNLCLPRRLQCVRVCVF